MPNLMYTLLNNGENEFITVIVAGEEPKTARDDHPHFEQIVTAVRKDDPTAIELFDIAKTIEKKFKRLSERVTARNGEIFLDGDPINNALSQQIMRFLDEGEDFAPLVNFFEKVLSNPVEHSREQLFKFLDQNGLVVSLAEDGDIVAYKGMQKRQDDKGTYFVPSSHGNNKPVVINGEEFPNSTAPEAAQRSGDVIELPRSVVVQDPNTHCSVGLHIATFDYANSYGNTRVEVRVNPRDVVSVPHDSSQKVRACRYVILDEVTDRYKTAVVRDFVSEGPAVPEQAEAPALPSVTPPVAPAPIKDVRPALAKVGDTLITEEGELGTVTEVDEDGRFYTLDGDDGIIWFEEQVFAIKDGPDFKVGARVIVDDEEFEIATFTLDGYIVKEDGTDNFIFDIPAEDIKLAPAAEVAAADEAGSQFSGDTTSFDLDPVTGKISNASISFTTDPAAQAVPAAVEPTVTFEPDPNILGYRAEVVHPTQAELEDMTGRAKRRKRNLVKYAAKHGKWEPIGEGVDLSKSYSWKVVG